MFRNSKQARIEIAKDTLKILERGSYKNQKGDQVEIKEKLQQAIKKSVLYKPDARFNIVANKTSNTHPTVIEITPETSLQAAKRLTDEGYTQIACLNFASGRSPGGGFLKGSSAQEESLTRSSGLYPCIAQMKEMYDFNHQVKSGFYSDYMIYSPQVPVFKDDEGNLLDQPYYLSFITAPAVNAGVVKEKSPEKAHLILSVMKCRIEKILSIASIHRQEALVLGAFGCGVFRNDPNDIAKIFKELLLDDFRFQNAFKKVVFAIHDTTPNRTYLKLFQQAFSPNI